MGLALTRPGKIICVGLNYRDHAAESDLPVPETPVIFAKWPSSVIGDGEPIVLPSISDEVDYEAELAVVVGTRMRDVAVGDALAHLAGITCLNDVSARDLQQTDGQWTRAKSLDSFCPVGPTVVPIDQAGDLGRLGIRCLLNGVVMQDSRTSEMIFGVPELLSFISAGITLEPGDIVATGTPPGVGFARDPAVFLRPGDVVTVEIDGIDPLTNPVVASA